MSSSRHARFEMEYKIIVVFDTNKEEEHIAYSYGDVLLKTKYWLNNKRIRHIEVRRLESFHIKTLIPEVSS